MNVDDLEHMIKRAESLIAAGNYDAAESLLDKVLPRDAADELIRKVKRNPAADDNDVEDDWSEPSDKKRSRSQADDDEDDEDDEDDGMEKLGPRLTKPRYPGDTSHAGLHYPEDDLTDAMNQNRQREQPEISRHAGGRTRFDDHVDHVKGRDGCSHLEAMSRARREKPGLFRASQGYSNGPVSKHAPPTWESLVQAEMAKGCNAEIAGQRVLQREGSAALRSTSPFAKSEETTCAARLQKRAEEISFDTGCDMTVALRKARLERPWLVQAMNIG